MKYPADSVLRFTKKGLRKAKVVADERLIVLSEDTVVSYLASTGEVTSLDMLKTHDSFVELANDSIPNSLHITSNTLRMYDKEYSQPLLNKYNIKVKAK